VRQSALAPWNPSRAPAAQMHELSIAMSLVELASEEAARLGNVRVEALHLRLGPLSGVVKEALAFSFEIASAGTAVEGSRLEIEDVPVRVFCARCGEERTLESAQHFRCPVCGELTPDVRSGRELELTAMEVTGDAAADR
jgi:hydrogenase nickel incorporation protein HypA/HybF